jgi:outer membrane protein
MKHILLGFLLVLSANLTFAQRFGYINSQIIVDKMPQYNEAKKEIDQLTTEWQKEIDLLQQDLSSSRASFEAEKVLLTEEMKKKRLEELAERENEVRSLQTKYFGFDGELFKKREQLLKNLQDKVFGAAKKIARKRKIHFIFDKASDLSIIYSDPTYDFTQDVLVELGLSTANTSPAKDGTNPPNNSPTNDKGNRTGDDNTEKGGEKGKGGK